LVTAAQLTVKVPKKLPGKYPVATRNMFFFARLMRRAFDRPPSGVCDSHSHDLDWAVAGLFDINRRHGAPGEHKACYHLSREALGHQLRIGSTTQAGVAQYSERTAPLGAKGHLRIPASAAPHPNKSFKATLIEHDLAPAVCANLLTIEIL
jgi:hypothetical protein